MDLAAVCILVVAVGCTAFCIGVMAAVRAERSAWLMRAETPERPYATPHHCDGQFYYVVREDVFVAQYIPRPPAGDDAEEPK